MTPFFRRNDSRGSMVAAMMVFVLFVLLVMTIILSFGSIAAVSQYAAQERAWEGTLSAWRVAVGADQLAELRGNTFESLTASDAARRLTRITSILAPSGSGTNVGVTVDSFTIGAPSVDPWSKANTLTQIPTMSLVHPWGMAPMLEYTQTITANLTPNLVQGARTVTSTVTFGVWSASDIGLILLDPYDASSGPQLWTSGVSRVICAGGFTASAAGSYRLNSQVISAPSGTLVSGATGNGIFGTRVEVHPNYAISWGTAPARLCATTNLNPSTLGSQSFYDRAAAKLTVVNGVATSALPFGVTIGEYPVGSGVTRVKVDVGAVGVVGGSVYINLLSASDRANGVAMIGASSASAGQHAVIATDGAVRLYGQNVMPCVLASAYGQVVCDDLSGGFTLAQTWVGSFFLPVPTAFNTPQSTGTPILNIQGSLLTGAPSGTVGRVVITETRNSTVRNDGPRFVSLRAVR